MEFDQRANGAGFSFVISAYEDQGVKSSPCGLSMSFVFSVVVFLIHDKRN